MVNSGYVTMAGTKITIATAAAITLGVTLLLASIGRIPAFATHAVTQLHSRRLSVNMDRVEAELQETGNILERILHAQPRCHASRSNDGQWVPRERRPSYPCCSWDTANDRFHTHSNNDGKRQCGAPWSRRKREKLRMSRLSGAASTYSRSYAFSGGFGCGCKDPADRGTRGERVAADWVPARCSIAPFSAARFCTLLGRRSILVVGDSTMQQAAAALMNAIHFGAQNASSRVGSWSEDARREGAGEAPGCHRQIFTSLSDTLIAEQLGARNRGVHWTTHVAEHDIVLLSAGAHIHGANGTADFQRVFREVRSAARTEFPTKRILWKTQSPGGCTAKLGDAAQYSATEEAEGWGEFRERDEWVLSDAVRAEAPPNFDVIDVRPLYLRGDDHSESDCLHFCNAGDDALHLIPRLLQNWLEGLDEA